METETEPQDDALVAVLLKLTELSLRTKWHSPELDHAYKEALRHAFRVVQDQRRELQGLGKARPVSNRRYLKPLPKD